MDDIPRVIEAGRTAYGHLSDDDAVHLYFDLTEKIQGSFREKDFESLLHYCITCLPLVERYAVWYDRLTERGFTPSPAIYYACRFLPVTGARGQLENIRELVEFLPLLEDFRESVQLAIESIETVKTIRAYLAEHPGTKQNQLKKALDYDDGRYLSQLVKDMEYLGKIERRKSGKTYELYVVDGASPTAW